MSDLRTNFSVLRRSRKIRDGDVFVMGLPGEQFLLGRVVNTDAVWTIGVGASPGVLVYVYRDVHSTRDVPLGVDMSTERLLVAPMITNRQPWTMGYFDTLRNVPLQPGHVLPQHCFRRAITGRYYDDRGHELPGPVEPVGYYGLHSLRTIDFEISGALGIPQIPLRP